MIGLPLDRIIQHAFMTPDLVAGMDKARELFGITNFSTFDSRQLGDAPKSPHIRAAFAMVGDLQIEIIQPDPDNLGLAAAAVAQAKPLMFHHLGYLVASDIYATLPAKLADAGIDIPISNATHGINYMYADVAADLGHYVEFIEDTPEWAHVLATTPR